LIWLSAVVGIVTHSRNGVTNGQLFYKVKPITSYKCSEAKLSLLKRYLRYKNKH
jgi:hypothetical protein